MPTINGASPPSSQSWLNAEVSLFDSAKHTQPSGILTIGDFLAAIKNGRWKDQVARLRELRAALDRQPTKAYKERSLPAATISGIFSRRNDTALVCHSGIVCADLDDLTDSLEPVFQALTALPETAAVFRSVSGNGLKALFLVSPDRATHRQSYKAAESIVFKATGKPLDKACINESRLCFVSYDPQLWINEGEVRTVRTLRSLSSPSSLSSLSGFDVSLSSLSDSIVKECLPVKHGQNHRMIFKLARLVRSVETRRGTAFTDSEQHQILKCWFDACAYKRHDLTRYWAKFLEAYDRVRFDFGADPTTEAFKTAMAEPFPEEAADFATYEEKQLIALAAQLEKLNAGKPWPLSCRKAAELIGTIGHDTANVYLRRMVRRGYLQIVQAGNEILAHRYRYVGRAKAGQK